MSFKIEPISDEISELVSEHDQLEEEDGVGEVELSTLEPTNKVNGKYKCLQKLRSSVKPKKSCSIRTCNGVNFDCRQILPEQRSLMSNQFWVEMNPDQRLQYILKNTEYSQNMMLAASNEVEPFTFYLTITSQKYKVCKKMFLSTLTLTEKCVSEIIMENIDDKKPKTKYKSKKSNKAALPEVTVEDDNASLSIPVLDSIKIEYVEVNPDIEEGMKYSGYQSEGNLYGDPVDSNLETKSKSKKLKPRSTPKVKKSPIKRKKMFKGESGDDSHESEDSWNEPLEDLDESSESGSEIDKALSKVRVPKIKSENLAVTGKAYSTRSTRVKVVNPPKVEPQSDVENNISSSDDENFSNVEDSEESDAEETNLNKNVNTSTKELQENYYSSGQIIPKKSGPPCTSALCQKLSRRKCKELTDYQRQHMFNEFWHKMILPDRKSYIKMNVEILEQKGRGKAITPLVYHLAIANERLEVCQRMFQSTLALQHSCIYNWVYDKNFQDDINLRNILDPLDMPKTLKARRRFENYSEKLQLLEDFLDALEKMPPKTFPQQKAHKNYLTENISGLRNLQYLYKDAMKVEGIINPLPVKILKKVFCAKHFAFYTGYKKRQAKFKTIDDTAITPEIEEAMKRDQQERQRDKILTKKPGSNIIVLDIDTCDLKLSPNWNCDAEESDPNSRLCCYNFTVSNVITLHTYNYWFCETDALDTTPSSFITCLLDYLVNFCPKAKQVIIYGRLSDERFKNLDMTNALLDYAIVNNVIIIQKFYIPRKHLYKDETECQSVYRSLYRKLRKFEIHLPSDYITATVDCKRDPLEAKWISFNQFRDYSIKSQKHRYSSMCEDTEDQSEEKIKSIICKPDGSISIKMDFDDGWNELPDSLKCTPLDQDWPQLFWNRRKISAIKYQLLQSLKAKLPRDCHFFYDYLTIEI